MVYDGPASYSDLCIASDDTTCCLSERGAPGWVSYYSYYSGDIVLVRFDLEWLTDGADRL